MLEIFKNSLLKGIQTKPISLKGVVCSKEYEALGAELKQVIRKRFSRSFHIREVDTGSCGACESEIISATNPIYDIQRFGVDFVASPRHADALLVTGPVSRNMELALKRTFEATPEPKLVITCGDCALDGGKFKNSYYAVGGVGKVVPVAAHVPGCPPKPVDIIRALLCFLKGPVK